MQEIAKIIITSGIFLLLFGIVILYGNKIGLGKLPGDIIIKKKNFIFYFPLTTTLLLSLLLSLILGIIFKLK